MMQAGQARGHAGIDWLQGSAERLPLAEASVDTLTIAFGIRNVTRIEPALTEILRVLRPGGRLLCLEFSTPAAWLRPLYDRGSRWLIPRLGAWIAGEPDAYVYLVDSIRRFPDPARFGHMIGHAGFVDVRWQNLSAGIACIHEGRRPLA